MARQKDRVEVRNLDDVDFELNVQYVHPDKPKYWFEIEQNSDETYSLGVFKGPFACNYVTRGMYVVDWKTFGGVVRFIKRQAVDPDRHHHHLFKQHDSTEERERYEGRLRVAREKRAEHDEAMEAFRAKMDRERDERHRAMIEAQERALVRLDEAGVPAEVSEKGHRLTVQLGQDAFELSWVEPRETGH